MSIREDQADHAVLSCVMAVSDQVYGTPLVSLSTCMIEQIDSYQYSTINDPRTDTVQHNRYVTLSELKRRIEWQTSFPPQTEESLSRQQR